MSSVRHLLSICDMNADQMSALLSDSRSHCTSLESLTPIRNLENLCVAVLCWPLLSNEHSYDLITSYDLYMTESFVAAAKRLGATTTSPNPHLEESLGDVILHTKLIMEQMSGESLAAVVIRHSKEGIPGEVAKLETVEKYGISVINGGDGNNENPTEGLVYMNLIWKIFRRIAGVRILIVGGVNFDPLAKSLILGLTRLGADIHIVAPSELVQTLTPGDRITVYEDFSSVPRSLDAVISIPVASYAFEKGIIPSRQEYLSHFSLSRFLGKRAASEVVIIPCEFHVPDDSANPLTGVDLKKLGARIEQPSDNDKLAVRMATLDYCLSPGRR